MENDRNVEAKSKGSPYKPLMVLGSLICITIVTMYIIGKILPSDVHLQINKAGITITAIGGAAFFILVFKAFFKPHT